MDTTKTYVFFGNVGAGKGTQIDLLKKVLLEKTGQKVVYVYPGNQYRTHIANNTYTGSFVKGILNSGTLVPDFMTNGIFVSILMNELEEKSHLIADGYPRSVNQSEIFIEAMNFYGRKNVEMIYVEVSKDEVIKRMKLRGRHDDTDEGISKRFEEYEKKVLPSLDRLKKEGYKFYSINGEQTVEEVHADVVKALGL